MRSAVFLALSLTVGAFAPDCRALEVGSSPTYSGLAAMQGDGRNAVNSSSLEGASARSGLTIDGAGRTRGGGAVDARGQTAEQAYARGYTAGKKSNLTVAAANVPSPKGEEAKPKIPGWAVYGGAAVLGGVQGFLSGGPLGAVVGAALGLAGVHMFQKGNYGASFGIMGGALLGSALGGPIGAVIGALIGGIIGHFAGKLFSGKKGKK